jgi:hypothetical protein
MSTDAPLDLARNSTANKTKSSSPWYICMPWMSAKGREDARIFIPWRMAHMTPEVGKRNNHIIPDQTDVPAFRHLQSAILDADPL